MTLRDTSGTPPLAADAYLIWTRRGNTGDHLIADGCERYLRDRGIDVWRSDGSLEDAAEAGERDYLGDIFASFRGMLIFAGGGNIGIYPDNEKIRAGLIASLGPRHRCLVLPQSARSPEPALHNPAVTVWCRDGASEVVLRNAGLRTELVPDAAFYMDDSIAKHPSGEGTFVIRRTPGRDAETVDHNVGIGFAGADLTFDRPLDEIVATLAPYEFVLSDRLHGALIALMMRKKTVLMPVGYHKMHAFYDTWLADVPSAAFVYDPRDLDAKMAGLARSEMRFDELFRRHADPALDRFLLSA